MAGPRSSAGISRSGTNRTAYWEASREDFFKLHDYAIDGVRRALPTARVGGPDTAGSGGEFMDAFLKHVSSGTNYATGQTGTPTDFLAFHAKGSRSSSTAMCAWGSPPSFGKSIVASAR